MTSAPTVLQQIDPQGTVRRTNDQRAVHLDRIKNLLDKGLTKAVITSYVSSEFGISRAQSYKDYDYAAAERFTEQSDNTPEDHNLVRNRDARVRMMDEVFVAAYVAKDAKTMALLAREIERQERMSGQTYGKP